MLHVVIHIHLLVGQVGVIITVYETKMEKLNVEFVKKNLEK